MFTVLNFLTPKKKKIKKFPSGKEEIKQTTYEKVVFDAQRTTPLNNNEAYWVVKGSLESDKIHKDLKYNPFLAVNSIIRWPEQNNQNLDTIVRALRKIKKEYCDSTNDFSENSWTKRFDELMTMFSIDTNAWPLFFAYAN